MTGPVSIQYLVTMANWHVWCILLLLRLDGMYGAVSCYY